MTGISRVPAPALSRSSRSLSRSALRASTWSACRPATAMRCSTLWMPSARRSTLNSRDDWRPCSRACVCGLSSDSAPVDSVMNSSIFASSASSSDGSGNCCCNCRCRALDEDDDEDESFSGAGGKSGGNSGGIWFFKECHFLFSAFNLRAICQYAITHAKYKDLVKTNRFILSSNRTIFSSCSIFRGLGFTIAGGLGTSSRENQSENSDFEEKSFSSWS